MSTASPSHVYAEGNPWCLHCGPWWNPFYTAPTRIEYGLFQ